jgi:alpha-tubulin suppressor-like RCC1 family protein
MSEAAPVAPTPPPDLRRFAARVAALYLLTGVAWFAGANARGFLLGTAVYFIFLLAFVISAAVPAWVRERRWIRASLATAVGTFLAAWVLLLAIDGVFGPLPMLGCQMHEVSEGGFPDAVCMGPLPFFSSGRRAWWYLPLVAGQALYVAFAVALATRALRWVFRAAARRAGWRPARMPARWPAIAMALGWIVPGALIAAAVVYDPVLEARWERREAEHQAELRRRGPSAHVFFRMDDDSLEVGDDERLVAWAWYSRNGGVASETLDSVRLSYASLAPAVATVDSTGLLHALAPGSARITVTAHALGTRARLAEGMADTVAIRVAPANAALRSLRFVDVAASSASEFGATCAVGADGAAYCWGYSLEQDAEEGDSRQRTFTRIVGPEPFAAVTVGLGHSCAVARSGRGYCWGDNAQGQLGIAGRRQKADVPVAVAGNHAWRQIGAGREHTCGVDVAGALFCWGSDRGDQIAPAAVSTLCPASVGVARRSRERWRCALEPTPVLARMRFREVAVGGGHTCALAVDGVVWCWGDNYNHESSPGPAPAVRTPIRIPLPPLVRLAAGERHNCGVDTAGRAFCWGFYRYGELKDEDPGRGPRRPLAVDSVAGLRSVSAGREHACGTAADGRAYCWGSNGELELGSGTTTDKAPSGAAVPVAGGLRFRTVAAGYGYTCGVSVTGGLYCWGSGLSFRFFGGNHEEHPQPFRLAGPPG